MVKKGGALDLTGAARIVLRDWSVGKFPRFTPPAACETSPELTPSLVELYGKDEETLSTLKTRKDIRKSIGLVKLVAGCIESRKADVEAGWISKEDAEQSETEGDDAEGDEEEDLNVDDVEEDDESEEEDHEPVVTPTGKRKWSDKQTALPIHPNKKGSLCS
jgi:nuclear GTP-binding protein